MPAAIYSAKPLQMVRDPSYFGLQAERKTYNKPKSIPWVDVSDDEGKNERKRKALVHHGHSHNGQHNGHNGPKHKKRKHSLHHSDSNGLSNGAGPSQPNNSHVNGIKISPLLNAKAKGIQDQRKQLPIAKGSF